MSKKMVKVTLTDEELEIFDDGHMFYKAGDTVELEGYLPKDGTNPAFSVLHNGYEDVIVWWDNLPVWLARKLEGLK